MDDTDFINTTNSFDDSLGWYFTQKQYGKKKRGHLSSGNETNSHEDLKKEKLGLTEPVSHQVCVWGGGGGSANSSIQYTDQYFSLQMQRDISTNS